VLAHREIEDPHQIEKTCTQLSERCRHILVTLGEDGIYYYNRDHRIGRFYPPFKTQIADPNGAGDAFVAGFVCGLLRNFDRDTCIQLGIAAAHLTLQSKDTVNEKMTFSTCCSLIQ
jgi:pseudouridine kinase